MYAITPNIIFVSIEQFLFKFSCVKLMSRFYFVRWIKTATHWLPSPRLTSSPINNNSDQLIYTAFSIEFTALCNKRTSFDSSFNTLFRMCLCVCLCMCARIYLVVCSFMYICVRMRAVYESMNANVLLYGSVMISLWLMTFSPYKHYIYIDVPSSISLFIYALWAILPFICNGIYSCNKYFYDK